MSSHTEKNKRLAKNTLLLYLRMIVLMLISLFTSRIVLDTLGEENYGIYNVVGGVVVMFTVLSGSLSSAITRFITYSLGKGDNHKLKNIFSTSVNIQLLMAVIVGLLLETVGWWFLNYKMNIPVARLSAANFVLQCSILTFCIDLISVPYNATIIAHEKMNIYAYFSILEAILKVLSVYLLYISSYDKLELWALLLLSISIIMRLLYGFYCKRNFFEATYHFIFDKKMFKEMSSFAGWNLFGTGAYMLNTEGVNMLMNVYFGVAVNAARALSIQVNSAVSQFVGNFTTALNPQITKTYAQGDYHRLFQLVNKGAKYSYFIMLIIATPIILEMHQLLNLWLKVVPDDTLIFSRLIMVSSLVTILGNSMYNTIMATGKIKRYQIEVTLVGAAVFPLTWIAYKLGAPAYSTYIIYIVIYFLLNFIRLAALKRMMNFPILSYIKEVLGRVVLVSSVSIIIPGGILLIMEDSFLRLLLVFIIGIIWTGVSIYSLGVDGAERLFIKHIIKDKILTRLRK